MSENPAPLKMEEFKVSQEDKITLSASLQKIQDLTNNHKTMLMLQDHKYLELLDYMCEVASHAKTAAVILGKYQVQWAYVKAEIDRRAAELSGSNSKV